jgi:hypothetical protein
VVTTLQRHDNGVSHYVIELRGSRTIQSNPLKYFLPSINLQNCLDGLQELVLHFVGWATKDLVVRFGHFGDMLATGATYVLQEVDLE